MMGLVAPVCLKKARCCFSIIRIGLIKGADMIEAPVAATKPGDSPSPIMKEIPKRIPNLGMRLKPTPIKRGPTPDIQAETGWERKTALASCEAILGSTGLPAASFVHDRLKATSSEVSAHGLKLRKA
jgi:hypothetical protein